ncbi:MAG: hypothetical protein KDA41_21565, partial [Planctomycetales bacterium]|nr:hypothetical protein [Planctomycetales bacterium]
MKQKSGENGDSDDMGRPRGNARRRHFAILSLPGGSSNAACRGDGGASWDIRYDVWKKHTNPKRKRGNGLSRSLALRVSVPYDQPVSLPDRAIRRSYCGGRSPSASPWAAMASI